MLLDHDFTHCHIELERENGYKGYAQAYMDIFAVNPNTNSFELLPPES